MTGARGIVARRVAPDRLGVTEHRRDACRQAPPAFRTSDPKRDDAVQQPVLLELPGGALGEYGRLRVLESRTCDPERLYERILSGRYGKPFIVEDGRTRRLYFSLRYVQSSMRIADPYALDFAYTRKMMAFLLFVPEPEHVVMVGLGGGSMAKFCHRHLPHTRLTVVEVNADVIALSAEFGVPCDERLVIVRADAADYLPADEHDTDVLLLDGFDADGISPAFLSRDFYAAARCRLRPGGVLVANFCGSPDGWHAHFMLLDEVFEGRVHLGRVTHDDNYIAFADADAEFPLDWASLGERAITLNHRFPLDFRFLFERLRDGADLRRQLRRRPQRASWTRE